MVRHPSHRRDIIFYAVAAAESLVFSRNRIVVARPGVKRGTKSTPDGEIGDACSGNRVHEVHIYVCAGLGVMSVGAIDAIHLGARVIWLVSDLGSESCIEGISLGRHFAVMDEMRNRMLRPNSERDTKDHEGAF